MHLHKVEQVQLVWHGDAGVRDECVGEWAPANAIVNRWLAEPTARASSSLSVRVRWEGGLAYESRVDIHGRQYDVPDLATRIRRDVDLIARPPEHPSGLAPHEWRVFGFPFTPDERRRCAEIADTCAFDDAR
ncbi:MAG TPA: hypothetical protein VG755_41950 [Nannocystaceae bacterium]|nr:hypothetical protein [Nannocystaceae bacterium]